MSTPNQLTSQEQKNLRNKAKRELARLENCLADQSTVQLLNEFKNKFNVCESVCKVILAKYLNLKKDSEKKHLQLDMKKVPLALTYAGYQFDRAQLNELFGSSSNLSAKGYKTAKKLRDAVTHGIKEKAVEEIISRKAELFGYMDAFLDGIRNFDSAK